MFDVRLDCLRRDLKSPSNAFIGAALADHREDVAFPRSERIADAAAGLRGAITIAGIPLRKQASKKGGSSRSFDVGVPVPEIKVASFQPGVIELLLSVKRGSQSW